MSTDLVQSITLMVIAVSGLVTSLLIGKRITYAEERIKRLEERR